MRLTAQEIAACTKGEVVLSPKADEVVCLGMTWDSRNVSQGDLYVALLGERVDGHTFVASAFEHGASAALVQFDPSDDQIEAARIKGAAIIKVASTFDALPLIAEEWRNRISACVIALTGSSGKTTTKGLVRQVLEAFGKTIATEGNQNNELGVPATVLRIQEDTEYAVIEMGMRGLGQLEALCNFVHPDMALVTNVGTSHMELLGSRENIARAKAEPFASLQDGGCAFINSSDDYVLELRKFGDTTRKGVEEVFFDGSGKNLEEYPQEIRPVVFVRGIEVSESGCPSFTLCLPEESAHCDLQICGLHNVHNAVAAAAIGWKLGMSASQIAFALQGAQSKAGRQQIHRTENDVIVIDDTYNANPDSMRASLSMFSSMKVRGCRIAVLGDMGELGSYASKGHNEIGHFVAETGIDRLYCIGELSKQIASAAIASGMKEDVVCHTHNAMDVLPRLLDELQPGDAVLVKASRSMALERIVEGLI